VTDYSDAEVFRQVGDEAEAQLAAKVKARQAADKVIIRVGSHRARETMHRVLGVKLRGHYRMSPNPRKITDGHDYYVLTPEQWGKVCSIKSITRAPKAITVEELGARWMQDS
jgi:hypothetical protein